MSTPNVAPPRRGLAGGIHPNVIALGFTSLFTDVSSEMLVPILPMFIVATLHASVAGLGVIEGVAECAASLLRLTSGWVSDRMGSRKPLVVAGYTLSGAAKACIALAPTWPAVLGLRFADRVGKGLRNPPRDALIADVTPAADRGRAFGLHRAMDTMGAAIGPLVGWALLTRWHALGAAGYRRIFAASAIPAALSVAVLLVFVRGRRPAPPASGTDRKEGSPGAPVRWATGPLRRFLVVDTIFQLGNSSMAFALLWTQRAGWTAAQVSLVYLAYNIVYALLALPFGGLSDRVGRRPLLLAGYALNAAAYALFAVSPTRFGVLGAFLLLGVYSALVDGQSRSFVADLVPREARARAFGLQATTAGLGLLVASVGAGELWDHVSPRAVFVAGGALALLAAALLAALLPSSREHQERSRA